MLKKELGEIVAMSLVKIMKKKSFSKNILSHRYLVLMPDTSMVFMNDISFYDGAISIIETFELREAIENGTIGKLIKRKTSGEYGFRSQGKVGNDSARV